MEPLTIEHAAWCRSHDWGRDAYFKDGAIGGIVEIEKHGELYVKKAISFSDLKSLLTWAGYQ